MKCPTWLRPFAGPPGRCPALHRHRARLVQSVPWWLNRPTDRTSRRPPTVGVPRCRFPGRARSGCDAARSGLTEWKLEGEVLLLAPQHERTHRRVIIGSVKDRPGGDLQAALERDGICRMPAGREHCANHLIPGPDEDEVDRVAWNTVRRFRVPGQFLAGGRRRGGRYPLLSPPDEGQREIAVASQSMIRPMMMFRFDMDIPSVGCERRALQSSLSYTSGAFAPVGAIRVRRCQVSRLTCPHAGRARIPPHHRSSPWSACGHSARPCLPRPSCSPSSWAPVRAWATCSPPRTACLPAPKGRCAVWLPVPRPSGSDTAGIGPTKAALILRGLRAWTPAHAGRTAARPAHS